MISARIFRISSLSGPSHYCLCGLRWDIILQDFTWTSCPVCPVLYYLVHASFIHVTLCCFSVSGLDLQLCRLNSHVFISVSADPSSFAWNVNIVFSSWYFSNATTIVEKKLLYVCTSWSWVLYRQRVFSAHLNLCCRFDFIVDSLLLLFFHLATLF